MAIFVRLSLKGAAPTSATPHSPDFARPDYLYVASPFARSFRSNLPISGAGQRESLLAPFQEMWQNMAGNEDALGPQNCLDETWMHRPRPRD
jgi:hypothetical protein